MPAMIPIPAGTPAAPCNCGDTIYLVKHATSGRPHPVSVKHVDAEKPTAEKAGRGISHFADCTRAAEHRKRR